MITVQVLTQDMLSCDEISVSHVVIVFTSHDEKLHAIHPMAVIYSMEYIKGISYGFPLLSYREIISV